MEMRQLSSPIDIKGFSVITNNHTEFSPLGKIPTLWQRFDNSIAVDYQGGERVYGVSFNYESAPSGDFSRMAGFGGDRVGGGQCGVGGSVPRPSVSASGTPPMAIGGQWGRPPLRRPRMAGSSGM